MANANNADGVQRSYTITVPYQSNKLPEQFKPNLDPPYKDLAEICHEHDIYLCDRLAKELYGIQDLSLHIDKIKAILNSKE